MREAMVHASPSSTADAASRHMLSRLGRQRSRFYWLVASCWIVFSALLADPPWFTMVVR